MKKYKAIVLGATGAVGRELVDEILNSPNYSKVTIFVRRKIDRWETIKEGKLNIVMNENLDFLGNGKVDLEKRLNGEKYDVLFNCLGSRVAKGDKEFKKVDYTYAIQSCEMCEKLSIPHFSLISTEKASSSSWFMMLRVKGEAEDEVLKRNVPYISIMRPGIIMNRDNDSRFVEKAASWVPFMPKILVKDLPRAMVLDDLSFLKSNREKKALRISSKEMLEIVRKDCENKLKSKI